MADERQLDELTRERIARLHAEWMLAKANVELSINAEERAQQALEGEIASARSASGITGSTTFDVRRGVFIVEEPGEHGIGDDEGTPKKQGDHHGHQ